MVLLIVLLNLTVINIKLECGGGSWSNIETYDTIHERDLVKNQFCLSNNYILIRIPYDKINTLTLEDLMGDKYKIYE